MQNGVFARSLFYYLAVFFLAGAFCLSSCVAAPRSAPPGGIQSSLVRIVDGDTIVVNVQGLEYKVRYIGMDAPEIAGSGRAPEYFGKEAAQKNRELLEGKTITMERDISETDAFGRLLRYVWAGDVMVNAELVRLGYARAHTYPPDVKYQDSFRQLEKEARENKRGLWSAEASK